MWRYVPRLSNRGCSRYKRLADLPLIFSNPVVLHFAMIITAKCKRADFITEGFYLPACLIILAFLYLLLAIIAAEIVPLAASLDLTSSKWIWSRQQWF